MPGDPSTSDHPSARISPTAHFVSYLKHRGGIGGPELTSLTGRLIHWAMSPLLLPARLLAGVDAQAIFVARHRGIDHLLAQAIERESVTQVIELAAGLSSRGREFASRYGDRGLVYVEGDLPGICAHKRRVLGPLAPGHHVVELDALLDTGPTSLDDAGGRLDPTRATAVICEGLLPYLDRQTSEALWRRIARHLSRYSAGHFFSDAYFAAAVDEVPLIGPLRAAFGALTRGRMHFSFHDSADVEAALAEVGFSAAELRSLGELVTELALPGNPDTMVLHLIRAKS